MLTNEQLRNAKKYENKRNYEKKWNHYDCQSRASE
jgi:hypothetical protein